MRTALKTGSWLAVVTGFLHTLGHFQEARPESEREAQMLDLMRSVRFDAGGVERSAWDIFSGLSLSFTVLMVLLGVHGLRVARSSDEGLVRATARTYAATAAVVTGLGLLYFPTPAIVCTGLMLVAYVFASFRR